MLNAFFTAMAEVVFRHEGNLDKFIGDCVMAVWGPPSPHPDDAGPGAPGARWRCRARSRRSTRRAWPPGRSAIEVGIGVNTGQAVVGYMGSADRHEFTAIGDSVNTASRLCGVAKGGEVLATEVTMQARGPGLRGRGDVRRSHVKGKEKGVPHLPGDRAREHAVADAPMKPSDPESAPTARRLHDVGVYVSGQRVLCRCGIRFEVRRTDVSIDRPRPGRRRRRSRSTSTCAPSAGDASKRRADASSTSQAARPHLRARDRGRARRDRRRCSGSRCPGYELRGDPRPGRHGRGVARAPDVARAHGRGEAAAAEAREGPRVRRPLREGGAPRSPRSATRTSSRSSIAAWPAITTTS